ncbi:hypothetical protein [Serratia fonticola]|uniref:Uncharacterized protein n=1 Tax=Serratia fonticola TaxID=47917 RepID=A0AAE7JRU3_SERFO|nr:hypothetical protein [Serratia fonticola]QKJ57277.1 hypothetical protein G9399_01275 [Serratia fonticola]
MRNCYVTPADAIQPIAAALAAAQHLLNDEYGKELAHELIAWAQETAVRVNAAQCDAWEGAANAEI